MSIKKGAVYMVKSDVKNLEKMKELVSILHDADMAYYRDDHPAISDLTYDRFFDELRKLEKETGVVLSNSPTARVSGEILPELKEVRHTKPMLSVDKTKSLDDIAKFVGKKAAVISWKLDGLTLVLRYRKGKFHRAITRGREGIIGEDVTHTVRQFMNVPLAIPEERDIEVRGEGVISWENFSRINKALNGEYAHPRNFAAGSTRTLDAGKTAERYLEFFAFDLVSDELIEEGKAGQLEYMKRCGFSVVPYVGYIPGQERLSKCIERFRPEHFAYPADGLVIEYNDIRYGRSLGVTGHHENRMIALKWEDALYETKFLGVELAATRTGMVSITAKLEPVEIDGTLVSRAYLHNLDIFESFKFGIGDTVKVYKANMIIPQIAENVTRSGKYTIPIECPCCGSILSIRKSEGGTRQIYCDNESCSMKLVRRFSHFCEKTRMNIEGLSDATLEKFVSRGFLKTFSDLYQLERFREEIVGMEGFGEKSFARLQRAVEKSRKASLARFIAGLGIPMVGRHAGKILDRHFKGSWDAFEQAVREGFDFTELPDFGSAMNENIYKWYADPKEEKLWRGVLEHIEFKKEEAKMNRNTQNPFNGKRVVATGKLMNYTRDGINEKLISIGAVPGSSVSSKTDFLIVGDKAGSKLSKARELGIPTISEAEFEQILAS